MYTVEYCTFAAGALSYCGLTAPAKEGRKEQDNEFIEASNDQIIGRLCFLATYTKFVKIDTLVLPVPMFIHTGSYGMTSYGPLRLPKCSKASRVIPKQKPPKVKAAAPPSPSHFGGLRRRKSG
jgi:hypothetical protein